MSPDLEVLFKSIGDVSSTALLVIVLLYWILQELRKRNRQEVRDVRKEQVDTVIDAGVIKLASHYQNALNDAEVRWTTRQAELLTTINQQNIRINALIEEANRAAVVEEEFKGILRVAKRSQSDLLKAGLIDEPLADFPNTDILRFKP